MKKVVDKVKESPMLFLLLPALGLGGTGTLAKFGVFDVILKPIRSIIYHQKIGIHINLGLPLEDAQDEAEDEMIDEGHWKPRGAE